MTDQSTLRMYEEVEREIKRTTYPESFPQLPEVPIGRYCDPAFYQLEIQHVWRKTWLNAAHTSELPRPGSYKLFEQFGVSIIISRGVDDQIRAFHNICRHRGAALVQEETGVARRFICPYHAWGYGADGQLISVPESYNFACLDKAERPLKQVRCETWRGFVFLNLDDEAGPVAEFMAPISKQLADFPIDDMVVKGVIRFELPCNWKVAYDNFIEIYHVNSVHPQSLAPYLDCKSFSAMLLANGHARFATRKRAGDPSTNAGRAIGISDGVGSADDFTARFREHNLALAYFPGGTSILDPSGLTWQTFWPAGHDKTAFVVTMLGLKREGEAEIEADKEFWAQLRLNQESVVGEDLRLFRGIQRSMESGELPTLLLGYQEKQIYWYHEEIDRKIGAENIPEHLRIEQVLGGHASE